MIVIWSEIHFQNDETQETMHSVSFSSSYKYFHSFWTWYSYYVVLKVIILNDFFSIHLNIGRIFWRWQSDDAHFFLSMIQPVLMISLVSRTYHTLVFGVFLSIYVVI